MLLLVNTISILSPLLQNHSVLQISIRTILIFICFCFCLFLMLYVCANYHSKFLVDFYLANKAFVILILIFE